MLVICYGMAKSGSTLAFELVRGVLESAGHGQEKVQSLAFKRKKAGNHLLDITREGLEDAFEKIGSERILAAKTHKPLPDELFRWAEEMQAARKLQVVASYRDPRDICLSLVDHGQRSRDLGKRRAYSHVRDLESAAEGVAKAIGKFRQWAALEGTLRLFYETVAFSPDEAIDAIERALGVTADHEYAKRHAFEDSFTQRNKAANKNRYVDEMDDAQKAGMLEKFGSFIAEVCDRNDQAWFDSYRDEMRARMGGAG